MGTGLPDATGWLYWKGMLDQGTSRDSVTNSFLYPYGEYAGVWPAALPVGSATHEAFLYCLNKNALGRDPGPAGLAKWINAVGCRKLSGLPASFWCMDQSLCMGGRPSATYFVLR